jgi:hypothetical protein
LHASEPVTDLDRAARRWLAYAAGETEDFEAWELVRGLVEGDDAQAGWELVRRLVELAADERLETIGAGPLEDLVSRHGAALVERITALAREDDRFRRALSAVWLAHGELSPEVERRIVTAGGVRVLEDDGAVPYGGER